ncbi:MAG: hypothetical protein JEZ04_06530 [Spirochaetales bacterium]|nr:hypothetical protein [Spirochaetales bacterium]
MLLISLIIIACIILLMVIVIISTSLNTGIVPMPSLPAERRLVSEILQNYPNIQRITDLGSGWGGLARHLTRRLKDRHIFAAEKSFVPHIFSRMISNAVGMQGLRHELADLYKITLQNNQAYITYLSGPAMKKLRASFERDQPTGGLLISIAFAMPGWTPSRVENAEGFLRTRMYIYEL